VKEHRLRTEIGSLLHRHREAAEVSRLSLARAVDATAGEIGRFERGVADLSLDGVERLFRALDLRLRIGVERQDAELDAEIDRLSLQTAEQRLLEWEAVLDQLSFVEGVLDGPIAAVIQGVPLPVDAVDVAMTHDRVDEFAAWLHRRGALRWSERLQEFRVQNADPRVPGALHWRVGLSEVRARVSRALPPSIVVEHGGTRYRVRPLAEIELDDPGLSGVLRRFREIAAQDG